MSGTCRRCAPAARVRHPPYAFAVVARPEDSVRHRPDTAIAAGHPAVRHRLDLPRNRPVRGPEVRAEYAPAVCPPPMLAHGASWTGHLTSPDKQFKRRAIRLGEPPAGRRLRNKGHLLEITSAMAICDSSSTDRSRYIQERKTRVVPTGVGGSLPMSSACSLSVITKPADFAPMPLRGTCLAPFWAEESMQQGNVYRATSVWSRA